MSKPSERNYWLDLFTGQTWQEFLDAGGNVTGFRIKRWKTVQRIKKGDYFVCYLTGVSRFIGILEVTSDAYQDTSKIWEIDSFPHMALTGIAVSGVKVTTGFTFKRDGKSSNSQIFEVS